MVFVLLLLLFHFVGVGGAHVCGNNAGAVAQALYMRMGMWQSI